MRSDGASWTAYGGERTSVHLNLTPFIPILVFIPEPPLILICRTNPIQSEDDNPSSFIRHIASHFLVSMSLAHLEMSILKNHDADSHFAYLCGLRSRVCCLTKWKTQLELGRINRGRWRTPRHGDRLDNWVWGQR